MGELIALTGAYAHRRLNKGKVAVFSAISKASAPIPADFHAEIIGEAQITRARSGFAQFTAHLKVNGEIVYEAEVMSGSASMADIMGGEVASQEPIAKGEEFSPFAWKPAEMTFIDRNIQQRLNSSGYQYPTDHLCPWPFPRRAADDGRHPMGSHRRCLGGTRGQAWVIALA